MESVSTNQQVLRNPSVPLAWNLKMWKLEKLKTLTASLILELNTLTTLKEIEDIQQVIHSQRQRNSDLLTVQDEIKRDIAAKQAQIGNRGDYNRISEVDITLIRHAESEFNVLEKAGSIGMNDRALIDCGLTAKGIEQCRHLRSEKPYDLLLVSPLRRCQQTLRYSQIQYHSSCTMDVLREYKVCILCEHSLSCTCSGCFCCQIAIRRTFATSKTTKRCSWKQRAILSSEQLLSKMCFSESYLNRRIYRQSV